MDSVAGSPLWRSAFLRVWFVLLLLKLALAAWLPLSSDEAYYWVWGHFLQWSYFDHPPMVGWLFGLGRAFDFLGQASRWPGVVMGHGTLILWRELLKPYLSDRDSVGWLVLLTLSPLIGVGSLIITPDVPLVFFWSLSLLCLLRALDTRHVAWFIALGAALGLGFCSKYPIVLFPPIALGWLGFSGGWRRVRWSLTPLTIFTGLFFCLPVLLWNQQHDWASFRFQLDHGLGGDGGPHLKWALEYVGGQIALIFPALVWLALRAREPNEARWLRWFAFAPLAFFLFSSFKARVEANWPIAAYPAVLSLAYLGLRPPGQPASRHWLYRITLGTWGLALVLVLSQVASPWLPIPAKKLKTNEFVKFDALLPAIEALSPVYASNYQMAATLSYRSKRMIPKLAGMNRRDFYDFQVQSVAKDDTFFLVTEAGEQPPVWLAERGYRVESSRPVTTDFLVLEVKRRAEDRDL